MKTKKEFVFILLLFMTDWIQLLSVFVMKATKVKIVTGIIHVYSKVVMVMVNWFSMKHQKNLAIALVPPRKILSDTFSNDQKYNRN